MRETSLVGAPRLFLTTSAPQEPETRRVAASFHAMQVILFCCPPVGALDRHLPRAGVVGVDGAVVVAHRQVPIVTGEGVSREMECT